MNVDAVLNAVYLTGQARDEQVSELRACGYMVKAYHETMAGRVVYRIRELNVPAQEV